MLTAVPSVCWLVCKNWWCSWVERTFWRITTLEIGNCRFSNHGDWEVCIWSYSSELNYRNACGPLDSISAFQTRIHRLHLTIWKLNGMCSYPSCSTHCTAYMPPFFLLMPLETPLKNSNSLSYWARIAQPSMQLLPITQRWYTKWKQVDTSESNTSHPCTTRKANTYAITWNKLQNNSQRCRENISCYLGLVSNKYCNFHGASAHLWEGTSHQHSLGTCTAKLWMEWRHGQA